MENMENVSIIKNYIARILHIRLLLFSKQSIKDSSQCRRPIFGAWGRFYMAQLRC